MPKISFVDTFSKIMTYFSFAMVFVYVGVGVFVFFTSRFDYIPREMRVIFSFFFVVYGFFRLARSIQKIRNNKIKNN